MYCSLNFTLKEKPLLKNLVSAWTLEKLLKPWELINVLLLSNVLNQIFIPLFSAKGQSCETKGKG